MEKRREQQPGAITSYLHSNGRVGVLLEVGCQSAFTAGTEEFQRLVHDLALHIAALNPKFIRKQDSPTQIDKPSETCLYEQPFIKDDALTVEQMILGYEMRLGEAISVNRFVRFEIGNPDTSVASSIRRPDDDIDSSGVAARLPKKPKRGSGAAHADTEPN